MLRKRILVLCMDLSKLANISFNVQHSLIGFNNRDGTHLLGGMN
jgi:hypothetical protein